MIRAKTAFTYDTVHRNVYNVYFFKLLLEISIELHSFQITHFSQLFKIKATLMNNVDIITK
jgi:hypothetical protein